MSDEEKPIDDAEAEPEGQREPLPTVKKQVQTQGLKDNLVIKFEFPVPPVIDVGS